MDQAAPKTSDTGVVIVSDADPAKLGAVVWWRLSGGLDLPKLDAAWEAEGLDAKLLPESPSPRVALRRAANEQAGPRRLVRPLPGGGFLVVDEVESAAGDGAKSLEHTPVARITLGEDGDSVQMRDLLPDGVVGAPSQHAVSRAFAHHRYHVAQGDVSDWLCAFLVKQADAVPLRDTGGVYFVPRYALPRLESAVRAVRAASAHVVSLVPAMTSAEAQTAFLDALRQAAERGVAEIERDLGKNIGARGLRNRIETADRTEQMVSRYESALGAKLDDVRAAILDIRARLSVAMTLAENAEAAEKAAAAE